MARFCMKCGVQMQDAAIFCQSCGQAVQPPQQQSLEQYRQPQQQRGIWGRFIADIPTSYSPEQVNSLVEQFMEAEGFKHAKYKDEPVLRKGLGLLAARKYIKLDVRPGLVHLEAFIPMYLLRGLPLFLVGEMNLDGPGGIKPIVGPKYVLRGCVDRLITAITTPNDNRWL